jgi:hypothetical protein
MIVDTEAQSLVELLLGAISKAAKLISDLCSETLYSHILTVEQELDERPSNHHTIVRLHPHFHVPLEILIIENTHRVPCPQGLRHDLLVVLRMALHSDDMALFVHALDTAYGTRT